MRAINYSGLSCVVICHSWTVIPADKVRNTEPQQPISHSINPIVLPPCFLLIYTGFSVFIAGCWTPGGSARRACAFQAALGLPGKTNHVGESDHCRGFFGGCFKRRGRRRQKDGGPPEQLTDERAGARKLPHFFGRWPVLNVQLQLSWSRPRIPTWEGLN